MTATKRQVEIVVALDITKNRAAPSIDSVQDEAKKIIQAADCPIIP